MPIIFEPEKRIFKLDAKDTSYVFHAAKSGYLVHIYYGKRVQSPDLYYLMRIGDEEFVQSTHDGNGAFSFDGQSFEYPVSGGGDYREPAIQIMDKDGMTACEVIYQSHKIYSGKPEIAGLPATYENSDGECTTLEVQCLDRHLNLQVTLVYTVFENLNVITRSVRVKNNGSETVHLKRVLSTAVDFDRKDFDIITLHGTWARERHLQRERLFYGKKLIDSSRGAPGHQLAPFMALCEPSATEDAGEVYGFNFVYSSNFFAEAELSQHGQTRFTMGINPYDFDWQLDCGEEFFSPEAVMVHSDCGFGKMSRTFHDLYRNNLIRGRYKYGERPVLLNCWEACYFDFDSDRILKIAEEASRLGIELLVMDDGWFGSRNDDTTSLGDWFVNENKIKGGLKKLVDGVNALGLKFGIWFEPEMISPKSKLYEEHPDWCIHIKGREKTSVRSQYVLDFSRKEVRDHIYEQMCKILRSANIEYIKWDMNRQLSEVGNEVLPASRQRELYHRYMLGVYDIQERLTKDFPQILFENCASGGARFDPGMLYYSPQIWTSDDTDSIERLKIQYGTNFIYPCSCMGSHVSAVPNHIVGRTTPFETRGAVALAGTFGYELDVTRLTDEEKQAVKEQIKMFKKYNHLVRDGDLYRIGNPFDSTGFDAWTFVSKDKNEALLEFVEINKYPNGYPKRIRLKGLDPEKKYKDCASGRIYGGDALMYAGIDMPVPYGDYASVIKHFVCVDWQCAQKPNLK